MTPTRSTNPRPTTIRSRPPHNRDGPTKLAPTMRPTDEPHDQPYKSHPPPTRPTTTADPTRQQTTKMASTIKHTVEFSRNRHTPPRPPPTSRNPSGATSPSYCIPAPRSSSRPAPRSRFENQSEQRIAAVRGSNLQQAPAVVSAQTAVSRFLRRGFRPRDQPFRAVSPRGSHLRSPHPVRSSRPGDKKDTTRRSARGANRDRHRSRDGGIPTRTAGQRARVTTARAFFPRRSSTCLPCRKSPSSSTCSSEVAFTLLT